MKLKKHETRAVEVKREKCCFGPADVVVAQMPVKKQPWAFIASLEFEACLHAEFAISGKSTDAALAFAGTWLPAEL